MYAGESPAAIPATDIKGREVKAYYDLNDKRSMMTQTLTSGETGFVPKHAGRPSNIERTGSGTQIISPIAGASAGGIRKFFKGESSGSSQP